MLREIYKNERGAWKQALFSYAINGDKKASERRCAYEYGRANPGHGSCAGCG